MFSIPTISLAYLDTNELLRFGSVGEGVQLLQRDLAQLGFNPGPIDGIFGNLTRNTVLRFQQQNNLLVDGIVGRQTKNAIRNLLKINSNNSVVYTVQRGDTLFFLAQRFNTTVSAIMEANGLSNHIIYINQKLLIPSINEISQQQQPSQTQQPQQQQQSSTQQLTRQQQMELEMLELVNQERIRHGLRPLIMDQNIVMVARLKSQDMIVNRYFAHHSPVYGSPFDMMRSFGITFRTAGENLAGSPSVIRAHTNLMNSPGHRANILNPNFTHIGIGIVEGGPYGIMFTQMFVGR